MKTTLRVTSVALLTTLLVACGGGGNNDCSAALGLLAGASCSAPNTPPVANAGLTQNVTTGSLVTLDGSGSRDANNQSLTYRWQITALPPGSLASLSSSSSAMPTFTADVSGTYSVSLIVNDGKDNSQASVVSIFASVNNSAPVANAGAAQNVLVGTKVSLDGTSSTDANLDTLTYKWNLLKSPVGSAAALTSKTSPVPSFTPDLPGIYVATLLVNDGKVDSALSAVTISASAPTSNAVPIANAGSAQFVTVGNKVTLDGTASSDANNDFLTYKWSLISTPTGSGAALSLANASKSNFTPDMSGVYVVSLVVNDGKVDSSIAVTTVTASIANSAPVAAAGANQTVTPGTVVNLDGSASNDANNDSLSYQWYLSYKPSGSSAALTSATTAKPTFTADLAGIYVASLVVNDGKVSSSVSSTTVLANTAPVANAGISRSVAVGTSVTLDGTTSTDANLDYLTYKWVMTSKPTGSNAVLSLTNPSKPTFTADMAGIYIFTLVVNDGKVDSTNSAIVAINAL